MVGLQYNVVSEIAGGESLADIPHFDSAWIRSEQQYFPMIQESIMTFQLAGPFSVQDRLPRTVLMPDDPSRVMVRALLAALSSAG
jgi:hypothetical protein